VRIAYETSLPGYGDRPIADFAIAELGNDAGFIGVADLATAGPSSDDSTLRSA
jgi:glucokinase